MTELSKSLFRFAHNADHLNAELRNLPISKDFTEDDRRSFIDASKELRDYLSLISRKAEYVASCLEVAAFDGMTDAKKAELLA